MHTPSATTKNSDLIYCIDEYVRVEEHREILKERWFQNYTLEQIAEAHNISVTSVKSIVYDIGDTILIMANEKSQN